MVHEMIDGSYRQTNFPNESPEYLAKREALRHAEIELMQQRERVAELRRALPKGATIQDYEFLEGPTALDGGDNPVRRVRMSELFTAPDRPHVIYHFMFGKKQTSPCPMCTSWIDCFNGIAHHLAQNVDLAIVAAADSSTLRAHARTRGWDKLRLLSAAQNTFKYDLGSEDRAGQQDSTISVFSRDSDGTLRHFYSVHPRLSEDIEERGIDEYNPIWNVMDLTPQAGRIGGRRSSTVRRCKRRHGRLSVSPGVRESCQQSSVVERPAATTQWLRAARAAQRPRGCARPPRRRAASARGDLAR